MEQADPYSFEINLNKIKIAIYLILLMFVLTSIACRSQTEYVQIEESEWNQEEIETARVLSDNMLSAQKNGGYYSLTSDEATPQMVEGLNESVQKDSYKTIKKLFGDYKDLEFEMLMASRGGDTYKIYRFKGVFESEADVEVRAVLDDKGKLAGFFVKPWRDTL